MIEFQWHYILEIAFALVFTYFFIKKTRPRITFLFLGYLFFLINVIIQFPFRYLQKLIMPYFSAESLIPMIIITLAIIVISQFTKYFSLKRFLRTRSYKNGILFGIGWSTVESISLFTITFFSYLFTILPFSFDYSYAIAKQMPFLSFIYFFVVNIATTVFVVISIIKDKGFYLVLAILFQAFVLIGINLITSFSQDLMLIITFVISLGIIFRFNSVKNIK
ncbi:MAG: hypothetical protein ACOCXG_05365 [Nanoarchaeota archaeon]